MTWSFTFTIEPQYQENVRWLIEDVWQDFCAQARWEDDGGV